MLRYELAGKFWEITLKKTAITTRFGKLDSQGQTRLKTFPTVGTAKAAYGHAINDKVRGGYVLAGSKTAANRRAAAAIPKAPILVGATDPQLEKAIDADPYDATAYSVYGDWLQGQGARRGELIALQLANKQAAATKLIAKHEAEFLGPLAEHQLVYDITYDRPRHKSGKRKLIRLPAFTWKYGFIHGLRLNHNHYALESTAPPIVFGSTLKQVLEDVLAHPSGRFLTEIAFTFNNDPSSNNLQDLIDVLAKKAPPTIRKLHFGDYLFAGGGQIDMWGTDTEISWYSVGNLGKLWKAVPGLTHLITQCGSKSSTQAGGIQLGKLDLPNLRHCEIRTGGLDKANAKAIAAAHIPNIEHLAIWYGDPNYGGNATPKDVGGLLDRTDLPKLRRLGVMNTQFSDELPALLASSKLIKRIRELDLSMGTLSDDGAKELAKHSAKLAHLDVLDVSHNYLTKAGIAALKGCAKKLVTTKQREQEAYDDGELSNRHPAVCE